MAKERTGKAGALYVAVGGELRRRRTALKLTQDDLAARLHLSRASIANVEAGRQALPLHHLVELAEALGTSASEVLKVVEAKPLMPPRERLPADLPGPVLAFVQRNLRGTP